MGDLLGLQGFTRDDWITLILCLPWPFILLGKLVPYKLVQMWIDLYNGSEAARERALTAMERGADALEATNTLVQATLTPLKKEADHDPAP
jgi:hypothetical protein